MKNLIRTLLAVLSLLLSLHAFAGPATSKLIILCYHEVAEDALSLSDPYAVDVQLLSKQLAWMKGQGYHFVSVDDILADRNGSRPLPEKAVLLSFDDGYQSMYSKVFPILKQFKAPAVVALVGSWLYPRDDQEVQYGDIWVPRSRFLSWDEIKEMKASGLIEIASHSFAMHKGITANPQGGTEPAYTSPGWDQGKYESYDAYLVRAAADMKKNSDYLAEKLGERPRVMVWPYGAYNFRVTKLAADLGMPITMSLDDGINTGKTPLEAMRRVLMDARTKIPELAFQFHQLEKFPDGVRPESSRIMHVDLDYIYDPNPVQQDKNIDALLDRVKAMGVSTVYLQAFADPKGTGEAEALYFPNRYMPMRADLFNRVAWSLDTRCDVKVYAWMPLLAFKLPDSNPAADKLVLAASRDGSPAQVKGYRRLSPYSAEARATIRGIYEDLARGAHFHGLLFHDDATLSDDEDVSADAQAWYQQQGLPLNPVEARKDPATLARWTSEKIKRLDDFSLELADIVKIYEPALKVVRNYYAPVVLNHESETWFAQSYASGLQNYDFVAVMAMPYMEKADQPKKWMQALLNDVKDIPGALDKTVFELQATNWRTNQPVPAEELVDVVNTLHEQGARHFAYYPDDQFKDQPKLSVIKRVFSMKSNPAE
ncbi:poly-beta-1,6-N-acetyl-D-glucosamine N-deacetylase PgaB [Aquitalea sp.]|uniref:poly-beta-1,6-N-acetyl-D-glucosamine N-deacetylase PgaB n=1 Tax=Aquitalea sp. TaxID=1872623 RepID=UPI00258AAA25|nr:poly-beta-1,6-N-acetyl-D-glucosamine N-deacetylase PgaB [Aquitalea sp.]